MNMVIVYLKPLSPLPHAPGVADRAEAEPPSHNGAPGSQQRRPSQSVPRCGGCGRRRIRRGRCTARREPRAGLQAGQRGPARRGRRGIGRGRRGPARRGPKAREKLVSLHLVAQDPSSVAAPGAVDDGVDQNDSVSHDIAPLPGKAESEEISGMPESGHTAQQVDAPGYGRHAPVLVVTYGGRRVSADISAKE